ncbi:DNA polymerase III subunit delta [Pseudooceanicola nanhaiensis]|jgi:DNA polymerase-3 subunit delta|uniref:DNA-directed DNA polymerase n=1 Tax=Pseudooceanicola nanhaiensis TaxID=375761 RepID=A0A917T2N0_9RHOB|nr:DNA polymerase III subunit delta [Pseudooceanicola nanhaiensis]GGM06088.1 DNA polymerase III subunit delta [Pseudooceanicola nanhaiensis]
MKLTARDAPGYFARPDADKTGLLIYGGDAMRVALRRQQVVKALVGPQGEEEMRFTRIAGADLRKDPAMLADAVKAVGFFPGPRVVLVEEVNETLADKIIPAVEDWAPGDAQVIVTAGSLKATSKLRKFFESHRNAYAVGIYDDPPSRGEIEGMLKDGGLQNLSDEAMRDLVALAQTLDPGDFRQTVEKLALYKLGDPVPVTGADIEACAPASTEAAIDDVLNVVAEAQPSEIGPVMARLQAQGVQGVALCIGAMRHFRTLYAVASHPGGPGEGIGRLRPPVFGPRRDRILRQAQGWGAAKLQDALTLLTDTDLQLRSAGRTAPDMALVERTLIRLAMMAGRR